MRVNGRLFLILFLLLMVARFVVVAVTIQPGKSYQDYPAIPIFIGVLSGLVLRDRPRSIAGVGITLVIALAAILIAEVSVAMLAASYTMELSTTNPIAIMAVYWSAEPAYFLFSILGLFLSIPVYWSREQTNS